LTEAGAPRRIQTLLVGLIIGSLVGASSRH